MTQGILYLIVFIVPPIAEISSAGYWTNCAGVIKNPTAKATKPSKNGMAPVIMTLKKVLEKRQSGRL